MLGLLAIREGRCIFTMRYRPLAYPCDDDDRLEANDMLRGSRNVR